MSETEGKVKTIEYDLNIILMTLQLMPYSLK
jgi:hypothetical protein